MLSKYYDDASVLVKMLLMDRWQPETPDTLKQKIAYSHSSLSPSLQLAFFFFFSLTLTSPEDTLVWPKALKLAQQGWEKRANAA